MPVKRPFVEWPCWYHGPDGQSQVFNSLNEVPYGWTKFKSATFSPVEPLQIDEESVRAELEQLGIEINPIWGKAHMKKVLDDSRTSR